MPTDPRTRPAAWITAISRLLAPGAAIFAVRAGAERDADTCLVATLLTAFFLAASLRSPRG